MVYVVGTHAHILPMEKKTIWRVGHRKCEGEIGVFEFHCEHCGGAIQTERRMVGKAFTCVACGKIGTVPGLDAPNRNDMGPVRATFNIVAGVLILCIVGTCVFEGPARNGHDDLGVSHIAPIASPSSAQYTVDEMASMLASLDTGISVVPANDPIYHEFQDMMVTSLRLFPEDAHSVANSVILLHDGIEKITGEYVTHLWCHQTINEAHGLGATSAVAAVFLTQLSDAMEDTPESVGFGWEPKTSPSRAIDDHRSDAARAVDSYMNEKTIASITSTGTSPRVHVGPAFLAKTEAQRKVILSTVHKYLGEDFSVREFGSGIDLGIFDQSGFTAHPSR